MEKPEPWGSKVPLFLYHLPLYGPQWTSTKPAPSAEDWLPPSYLKPQQYHFVCSAKEFQARASRWENPYFLGKYLLKSF